jgi:hypothetical protein
MTNLVKIVNVITGVEIERVMNAKELAQYEETQKDTLQREAQKDAALKSRQSGLEKLAALGLTPEEISAITGA